MNLSWLFKLIKFFAKRAADIKNEKNTALFQDPEATTFIESGILKEYNEKLKENPELELP